MSSTFLFLIGPDRAYKMNLLDQGLCAIEQQYQAYFDHFPLDATARPVYLADLVQVHWQAGVPMMLLDPNLPAPIAAACLACLQRVRAAHRPRGRWAWWQRWSRQLLAVGKRAVSKRSHWLALF